MAQHIGQHLAKLRVVTPEERAKEQSSSLTRSNQTSQLSTLPIEQRAAIELKYKSDRIQDMADDQVMLHSKSLLLKIHVITGWSVPEDDDEGGGMMTMLSALFLKSLKQFYGDLNPDEIEYAFLKYGSTIEDWGKNMNLNLIDKVLLQYRSARIDISFTEEKVKALPPPDPAPEVSDEAFIEALGEAFAIHRDYKLIPVLAYKILEHGLALSKEDKWRIHQIVSEQNKDQDHESIKVLCMQYAVAEHFRKVLFMRNKPLHENEENEQPMEARRHSEAGAAKKRSSDRSATGKKAAAKKAVKK